MGRFFPEMFCSAAAIFGGRFAAYMTSFLLVCAGIALAVSVVFFAGGAPAVRLRFVILPTVLPLIPVILPVPAESPMR